MLRALGQTWRAAFYITSCTLQLHAQEHAGLAAQLQVNAQQVKGKGGGHHVTGTCLPNSAQAPELAFLWSAPSL